MQYFLGGGLSSVLQEIELKAKCGRVKPGDYLISEVAMGIRVDKKHEIYIEQEIMLYADGEKKSVNQVAVEEGDVG